MPDRRLSCRSAFLLLRSSSMQNAELLQKFVDCFEKLDEMSCFKELDPIAYELRSGEPDEYGGFSWRVVPSTSD